MAGRATLIKSVASTIPIYAMQTTLLPQNIIHQLDKMNCRFLWGDTGQHRSCHTVNWETVTMRKEAKGLGLTSIRHRNQVILMHQAWRLYTNPDTIWARILKAKYFLHSPMFDDTRRARGLTFGSPLGTGSSCYVREWARLWGMARTSKFGKILGFPVAPFEVILKVRSYVSRKIAGLAPCELITFGPLNLSPSPCLLSSNSLFRVFLWPKSLASQIPFSGPTTIGSVQLNLL